MSNEQLLDQYAAELEAAIAVPEGVASAPAAGSMIASVLKLITAIKARDYMAMLTAIQEIIGAITGTTAPATDGPVSFAPARGLFGAGNFLKIVGIISKLLPLILGA